MHFQVHVTAIFFTIFQEIVFSKKKSFCIVDVILMMQLDDALSATRLPDGRIKVWIHVADPSCLVEPHSIIDRFLPFFL